MRTFLRTGCALSGPMLFWGAIILLCCLSWPSSSTAAGIEPASPTGAAMPPAAADAMLKLPTESNQSRAMAQAVPGDQGSPAPERESLPPAAANDAATSKRRRTRGHTQWFHITWRIPIWILNILGLGWLLSCTIESAASRSAELPLRETFLLMFEDLKLPLLMSGSLLVVALAISKQLILRRATPVSLSQLGEGFGAVLCVLGLLVRNRELAQTGVLTVVSAAVVGACFEFSRVLGRLGRFWIMQKFFMILWHLALTTVFFLLVFGLLSMNLRSAHAQEAKELPAAAYNNSVANLIGATKSRQTAFDRTWTTSRPSAFSSSSSARSRGQLLPFRRLAIRRAGGGT